MRERHYFGIRYLPRDVDVGLLAGRCIKVLHGFLSAEDHVVYDDVGVSFPQWNIESVGQSIAFVSHNAKALNYFRQHPYFQMMSTDRLFKVSPILKVPQELPEVRFKRNQNIAKCFSGDKRRRLARAMRRAESRGELFQPELGITDREIEPFHRVFMSSQSSQQHYLLHIQKEEYVSRAESQFSRYGLATNKEYRGTVPDLSRIVP
ncbi:type I-F CRISPR-associated endoribonuclease Cas6/Csy4 [Photobacterium halotolerans]|uniref:type I-F CRISPR-associated endoribonuclease Cas6/Csy4 n=1 Tax=Photobacterium halotolerans TaxID=265726 RepID=UPI00137281F0|nr:type I-F CRISPR-associated endoribonuclease Cas6/Csy4 [Photobacterium halotolerans]NAW87316.1 type I-F CRISPR-associated endoribonuclease Cas6/Csy4 [Photobacterium halotolerans]